MNEMHGRLAKVLGAAVPISMGAACLLAQRTRSERTQDE